MRSGFSVGFLAICLVIYSLGCVSTRYNGITPLEPAPHSIQYYRPVDVAELAPSFRWETTDSEARVDLAIWEARNVKGNIYEPVTRVYLRQGLAGGSHRLEQELRPDTVYLWSIRKSGTADWSTSDHSIYGSPFGRLVETTKGDLFLIRTPK